MGIKVDSKKKKKDKRLVLIKDNIRKISNREHKTKNIFKSSIFRFQLIKIAIGNKNAVNIIKNILKLSIPNDKVNDQIGLI
jgi:hypothetical protein